MAERHGIDDSISPTQLIRELEKRLDTLPEDQELRRLLEVAFDLAHADDQLDVAPYGLHRKTLIGWDRWSTTWLGHNTTTGHTGQLRILRPDCRTDPVARRVLERDAGRLFPVVPGLQVHPDALSISQSESAAPNTDRSLFITLIVKFSRWSAHNLGWPERLSEALHVGPAGLEVLCLTPQPARTGTDAWDHLTSWLKTRYDLEHIDRHEPLLRALTSIRGESPEETLRMALRSDLVRQWHTLRSRRATLYSQNRAQRFQDLLERLHRASPPPEGRAAVGVTPEGRLTVVQGDGSSLAWGTDGELTIIVDMGQPINAPAGRQLLRARAMASPSPHLQTQAGGDARYLEHATQWVSAALKLRTLRLLVQRQTGT